MLSGIGIYLVAIVLDNNFVSLKPTSEPRWTGTTVSVILQAEGILQTNYLHSSTGIGPDWISFTQ